MFEKQRSKARRMVGGAGLGLAFAAIVAAAPAAAATPAWKYFQLDNDRYYDAAARDMDGNGTLDDMWFDLDNDNAWDTHLYNTKGGDSLLEEFTYNPDEDGFFNLKAIDTDQRIGFDALYLNDNDDGTWDRVVTASTPNVANVTFSGMTFSSNPSGSFTPSFPSITPNPNYATPECVFLGVCKP